MDHFPTDPGDNLKKRLKPPPIGLISCDTLHPSDRTWRSSAVVCPGRLKRLLLQPRIWILSREQSSPRCQNNRWHPTKKDIYQRCYKWRDLQIHEFISFADSTRHQLSETPQKPLHQLPEYGICWAIPTSHEKQPKFQVESAPHVVEQLQPVKLLKGVSGVLNMYISI